MTIEVKTINDYVIVDDSCENDRVSRMEFGVIRKFIPEQMSSEKNDL